MRNKYITIDGSMGEGGGQVLRAALALSMASGRPFHMVNIRANRPKPGLKRQHLTCVKAAQALCGADVKGDALNSQELVFRPGAVRPGEYAFNVGTGGSVTLVLQALVPALLLGSTPSRLTVTGGTHVPYAPPFEFMRDTLFPRLEALGPRLAARMNSVGYMDIGGGSVTVDIHPATKSIPFNQQDAEPFKGAEAAIYGHNLPDGIIQREIDVLLSDPYASLGLTAKTIRREDSATSPHPVEGTGNMVLITVRHGRYATVLGECGWRGRTAEVVARQACKRALRFARAHVPVEEHLVDQLLVPLAIAGGGSFAAESITPHTQTCLAVIEQFTNMKADLTAAETKGTLVTLR